MHGLKILFLSFYNLDYGIGASASLIDQLNDLPPNATAVVIEPNRVDLPHVKAEFYRPVKRIKVPIPLKCYSSFLFVFTAFFYGLKTAKTLKPHIIFSMHHPFHFLSLTGHIIARALNVLHVVDFNDVWRPMGLKPTIRDRLFDILERKVADIIKNDLMIFVCSEHQQILESRSRIHFKKAIVLPNCVSHSLIKRINVENTKVSREIKNKEIRFIFVGRVGREYAIDKIKPVLDALRSRGYKPSLLIVGHSQVCLPQYATCIGELSREETLQTIAKNDIGVGPMNPTTTIPKKVVEYLVLGKIIVVGRNAVSKDILKEYEERFIEVAENSDVNQVVFRLLKMLENANYKSQKNNKLYCEKRWEVILSKIFSC